MEDEFDTVARWTEQAVAELGPEYAIPAGCRGSGSPAALDWLAAGLELAAGDALLDAGAGVGGPAAYLRRSGEVRPYLTDPMLGACVSASRLFAVPAVVGSVEQLPFADRAFGRAWCLGVLSTIEDKASALAQLRRVLTADGRLGLLTYLRTGELPYQPEGNFFATRTELTELLASAGFEVTSEIALAVLPDPPSQWQRQQDEVDAAIARGHAADPRWQRAEDQSNTFGSLLKDGLVEGRLLITRCR